MPVLHRFPMALILHYVRVRCSCQKFTSSNAAATASDNHPGCGHGTAVPHVRKARQKGQQVTLAVRSRKTGLLSQGYLESIFEQKFMISTLWPFWEHTRYNPVNSFKVVQILQRDIYNEAPSLSRGLEGKTCISFAISGCQISLGRCQLAQKNKKHIS